MSMHVAPVTTPRLTRRVLITGANAGIGRAAACLLAAAGHELILGCRNTAAATALADSVRAQCPGAIVRVLPIDMASQASIRAAAERVDAVDVLIHNAASFDVSARARRETPDGIEVTWATNHLGPALLTELLLPRLRASPDARVLAITSKGLMLFPRLAVDLADPEYRSRPFSVARAYYQSKLAHLAWMLHEAERHRGDKVRFHAVRVTNVKIDLTRYPNLPWPLRALYRFKSLFSITPEEMAKTYIWCATSDEAGASTGGYWDAPARAAPLSRWANDARCREALAQLTRTQLSLA